MSETLRLADLAGIAVISIPIGGEMYRFSQLPVLPQKANLDAFLREKIPNPMEVVKPYLAGVDPEDRRYLLNEARKEAADWPPCLETQKGRVALLGLESGLVELFYQALTVQHPNITRDRAMEVYRAFEREQGAKGQKEASKTVTKLMAIWFNGVAPEDVEGLPKGGGSQPKNDLTGGSYSDAVSAS